MGAKESKDMVGDYIVEREEVLGSGSFGTVYRGFHRSKKTVVAMKQCLLSNPTKRAVVHAEIASFQKIPEHRNIVKLLNFYSISDSYWFIMEYCDRRDLDKYMIQYCPDLDRQLKLMLQCASGVAHMHKLVPPLVHRDIKPSNILIKVEEKIDVVKIADFGVAKFADELGRTVSGTCLFRAPEMVARRKYDESVDVFALGLVFLGMIQFNATDQELRPLSETCLRSGDMPIALGEEMENASRDGKPMPTVISVSLMDGPKKSALKQLILDMTSYEPKQRKRMDCVVKTLEETIGEASAGQKTSKFKEIVQLTQLTNWTIAKTETGGDLDPIEPNPVYDSFKRVVIEAIAKNRMEKPTGNRRFSVADALKKAYHMPVVTLLKLMDNKPADQFEVGDGVMLEPNVRRAQYIQELTGKWKEDLRNYIGRTGEITNKLNDEEVDVRFADGKVITLSASLLDKVPDTARMEAKGQFKIYDIVAIGTHGEALKRLQRGHGGYDSKMANVAHLRGVVRRIDRDGDVTVEFIGSVWLCFNPSALVAENTSDLELAGGDAVLLDHRPENVKAQQKGHGEWVDHMKKCLGQLGIVKKVVNAQKRALVEMGNCSLIWNTQLLTVVNKSEEMIDMLDNTDLVRRNSKVNE